MRQFKTAFLAVFTVVPFTLAHVGHGHQSHANVQRDVTVVERDVAPVNKHNHIHNHGRRATMVARAKNPHGSTEASAAQLTDPSQECKAYDSPGVDAMMKDFPKIWDVADILPNDKTALQIMQQINASGIIPKDIAARGVQPASLMGTGTQKGYDENSDPDCYWTATTCTTPKHPGILPDVIACPEAHTWGYTMDDGPNCTHNALYDFWQQNNQKVSLFYIGSNVMDWPLEAQRGLVDGHHICVHTWSHHYMTALTTDQAFAELYYTLLAIRRVMGVTVTCWRPPFGDVDDRIRAIAQSLGLRTIIWTDDTDDWEVLPGGTKPTATVVANYNSIISKGSLPAAETGGIVVLEHELNNGTMQLVVDEYPAIKKAWPNVVPLTACLNLTHPYVENITYPVFSDYVAGKVMAAGLPSGTIAVDSTAVVTPQGTLSGMGGLMATAPAGGPDNPGVASSSAASSGGASKQNLVNQKSSAAKMDYAPFALMLTGLASGAYLLASRCFF